MQEWAFVDAFATPCSNREDIRLRRLSEANYLKRIWGSCIGVRQALEYGCRLLNELVEEKLFDVKKTRLEDDM